jgi:type III restriction enzyme
MIQLRDFQKTAIDDLSQSFLSLWARDERQLPIIFKAPTGSGKTLMIAEFIRCLDDNYQFYGDKAFLWISFGGDTSYSQSKKKFYQYLNEGTDLTLKDISNLNERKLDNNNIFFINWSKIKGTDKESRKLRKDTEFTVGKLGVFDEYIKNTKKERELILIIDEAHTETSTSLAQEVIDLIDPKIILKVTATPKDSVDHIKALAFDGLAGFIEVEEADVIKSGLIKEKIIIQTEEDIAKVELKGISEDTLLLQLAMNKRAQLKKKYKNKGIQVNPLVMIQLPSDLKEKEDVMLSKKDIFLDYLYSQGVKNYEIAIWLSEEKRNLNQDQIVKNNNGINYLLFKVAPATGWDCPRAQVLVMYREISSPSFHTQIIGRIKRMPEAQHYDDAVLNKAYIFTNYNKQHIKDVNESENPNKPPVYFAQLKEDIEPLTFHTTYHGRADYNTLTPPHKWQESFLKTFDDYFGTKLLAVNFKQNIEKINQKISLANNTVDTQILVGAEIDSFDNFISQLKNKSKDISYKFSSSDIERLYNLALYNEIKHQTEENSKFNASRSWQQLKSGLNTYIRTRTGLGDQDYYGALVRELLRDGSKLKQAIHISLINFKEGFYKDFVNEQSVEKHNILVPDNENSYTEDYDLLNEIQGSEKKVEIKKSVYKEFYLKKKYDGRDNEVKFIRFLEENENVIWWHKQSDSGKSEFAVEYYNKQKGVDALFFPDFIIKTLKHIYVLDTKGGFTASEDKAIYKNEALQVWVKTHSKDFSLPIIGGLVKWRHPTWVINTKPQNIKEDTGWDVLAIN